MATRSTGKSTQSKASAPKKKKEQAAPEPKAMDANSVDESMKPEEALLNPRVAYGLETLVEEVRDLFPETIVVYGDYTPGSVALSATFDLDNLLLGELLPLIKDDPRVSGVGIGSEQATVILYGNARTQDSRDSFGLADAFEVLDEPSPEGHAASTDEEGKS